MILILLQRASGYDTKGVEGLLEGMELNGEILIQLNDSGVNLLHK